jgi:uncharacterized protein YndB with AHSA1/START domain
MIVKSVVLPCSPPAAFALFTEHITEWWPPERRHSSDPHSVVVLSQHDGLFERDSTGRKVELGLVKCWEPPTRIVLDWYPGTDRDHPTEVEVHFLPEGQATRVEVRHRATPASASLFPTRAPRYATSWELVLAALERALPS